MLTLITHIYNEEWLLPNWIEYHRDLFDDGIVIDYHSTDRSMEIVRELAPNWKIITTRNSHFIEPDIGNEVEDIESSIDGWKMVLNTTEYVFVDDLRYYCRQLEKNNYKAILSNGVILVDGPDEKGLYDPSVPLPLQKSYGYFEEDCAVRPNYVGRPVRSRSRLLHRHTSGKYTGGRHGTFHEALIDEHFFLCWVGWAALCPENIRRRIQIQHKASEDVRNDEYWARLYVLDEAKIERMYQAELRRSYNLLDFSKYRTAYGFVADRFLKKQLPSSLVPNIR